MINAYRGKLFQIRNGEELGRHLETMPCRKYDILKIGTEVDPTQTEDKSDENLVVESDKESHKLKTIKQTYPKNGIFGRIFIKERTYTPSGVNERLITFQDEDYEDYRWMLMDTEMLNDPTATIYRQ